MKRVGFITSNPLFKTGFSTNIKCILPELYKSGKYELFLLCQGTDNNDGNLTRMPWKSFGVFNYSPNFNAELFQRDGGYQRIASYGNLAVEKFIIDNKLDCVVHIEDIWSSNEEHYINNNTWWKYFKNNFLQWSTADSLPILDSFKNWAKACPNIWFWSQFGVDALHKEDYQTYKHVKHVFGVLDINEYHPIPNLKKTELRQRFNIDLNTNIFIQLGRNQLRKIFVSTLEAFSIFKKRYPEHKAKLLFHCSFSEGAGWPLDKTREYYGLDKEDLLTTYNCRVCNQYEIKPFDGEDKNCRFCGAQKSQITAGVMSGITNETLSEIYGIADASLSIFTSGGMEYTNPQSLLCGLPLLCSNYSCGEDFVKNNFVFELDGTHTFECPTGFIKHVPNLNTIVKFFKTICEMPGQKRREIGMRGKKWATERFHVNTAVNELEKFIDNCPPIEWDYTIKPQELKNPNANIEDMPNSLEWVKHLYESILNMRDMRDDDTGVQHWVKTLKHGGKREDVVNYFRKVAIDENAKNQSDQQQISLESLFKTDDNKQKVCLVLPQSIGDNVILTSLLPEIREKYPRENYTIFLATDPKYFEIYNANDNIDKLVPFHPIMRQEMAMIGSGLEKGVVDYFIDVSCSSQIHLNYLSAKY